MNKYHIIHMPEEEQYRVWKLYPDTYVIHCAEAMDTFLLLGEKKALLIDTAYGRGEFPNLVEACLEGRELMVVNTHGHIDHVGGNGFYPKVYMHKNAIPYCEMGLEPFRIGTKEWMENMPYPNYEKIAIEEGYQFDLGGRQVEVLYTPAHSDSSLTFLDHGRRLLFVGDELDATQANLNHLGSVRAFLENCRKLEGREEEYDFLMPNHNGTPICKDYLNDFILCAQHILDGIPDSVSMADFPEWKAGFWGKHTVRAEYRRSAINYVNAEPEEFLSRLEKDGENAFSPQVVSMVLYGDREINCRQVDEDTGSAGNRF